MQIVKLFIIAAIVAFVPVLALPVNVESQEVFAREPISVGEWFGNLGKNIKQAFVNLGHTLRSVGKPKAKSKAKSKANEKTKAKEKTTTKTETTPSTPSTPSTSSTPETPPVQTRELGSIYAREGDDGLYIRGWEFSDDLGARYFDDELEAREVGEEFDVREPSSNGVVERLPRELYDIVD